MRSEHVTQSNGGVVQKSSIRKLPINKYSTPKNQFYVVSVCPIHPICNWSPNWCRSVRDGDGSSLCVSLGHVGGSSWYSHTFCVIRLIISVRRSSAACANFMAVFFRTRNIHTLHSPVYLCLPLGCLGLRYVCERLFKNEDYPHTFIFRLFVCVRLISVHGCFMAVTVRHEPSQIIAVCASLATRAWSLLRFHLASDWSRNNNIPENFSGVHGFTGKTVKEICSNVRKWSKVNVPLFPNIPKQFPCSLKVILKYSLFPKGKWLCSLVPSNPWEALKNTNSTVTAFPTCSSTFSSANELSRKSAS